MVIRVISGVTVFKCNSSKEEGEKNSASDHKQYIDGQHTDVAAESCVAKAPCNWDVTRAVVALGLQCS